MVPSPIGLVVVTLLTSTAPIVLSDQRSAPLTRESCSVTVFGSEHPDRVPDAIAWERAFDRLLSNPTLLQDATRDAAKSDVIKGRLLVLQNELARARVTQSGASRVLEIRAARAVLDARDDLIRILPPDRFQQLQSLASDVSDVVFELPMSGSVRDGRCSVTARGRDFPELVPESHLWRFYIQTRAAASRKRRGSDGRLWPEHLKAVQSELPLPPEDVQRVVDRCIAVADRISSIPFSESSEQDIARTVLDLRAEFIRTFSPAAWSAIKADAERFRDGMSATHAR